MKISKQFLLASLLCAAASSTACSPKAEEQAKDVAEQVQDKTREIAEKTADETREIAGDIVDKTKEVVSATGETITDAWITTKLTAKFADEKLLKDSDIKIETNDRTVTLKGTVASAAGKSRAESVALGTEGVSRVVNQLTVKVR